MPEPELGGSEYLAYLGEKERGERYIGRRVPRVDIEQARARYHRVHQALQEELFSAVHSVGVGGLGFGLCKMTMAGELGAEIDLSLIPCSGNLTISERLLKRFEEIFAGEVYAQIGVVIKEPELVFKFQGEEISRVEVLELKESYKKTLGW